jgi:hypothetical protein
MVSLFGEIWQYVDRDDSVSDDGRRGGDARRMTLSQRGSLAATAAGWCLEVSLLTGQLARP